MHAKDVSQALYRAALWVADTPKAHRLKEATELAFPFGSGALASPFKSKRNSVSDEWKTVRTVVPSSETTSLPLFFVADDGNSTQDSLAKAVAKVWGVEYGFMSSSVVTLVQQFAKVSSRGLGAHADRLQRHGRGRE